jgi:glutamate N-acetyltransferase/amino-acid N-acetyltransferase
VLKPLVKAVSKKIDSKKLNKQPSMSKPTLGTLYPVTGIRLSAVSAGIKKPGRRDVVLVEICDGATVAATFTQNAFCAAPVSIAKQHLSQSKPRYLLINTGNANAGTGEQGLSDAMLCCQSLAHAGHCDSAQILPFSTGVIGEPLPVNKITTVLESAVAGLNADQWDAAAHGIMTTDTVPKGQSRRITIDDETITITGIAKGSGMIRPDMATMLAYVATDAKVSQDVLQAIWRDAVANSFNKITVDGDTSTNDSAILIATGKSGLAELSSSDHPAYAPLKSAVCELCEQLAMDMVRDGEGATKLITIYVSGGGNQDECDDVAFTVAHSPLVKTAMFASDPNWGRILAAVGRAGLKDLDIAKIQIDLDDVCIVRNGGRAAEYTEEQGQQVMKQEEISVRIDLNRGDFSTRVWTCDFSYDYVRINAEYRT